MAEAVKRYAHVITAVRFINNSMKMRNSILAIQSIEKHLPNLQIMELSKNELGYEGGKYLATQILKIKKLQELRLADC